MMQVVWFKRDLRIYDHAALTCAAQNGAVLPLYILEPDLWAQPDMSFRQYEFLAECLAELDQALKQIGQGLVIKLGEARVVLEQIHCRHGIDALWSHQETWNGWTYDRDLKVREWIRSQNIPWLEPVQNGVIRRLKDRDGWAARWYHEMKKPVFLPPALLPAVDESSYTLPRPEDIGLAEDGCTLRLKGGRREALQLIDTFLSSRGEGYTKEMSSPLTAYESCSRLSPHLAFGTLSIREVSQAVEGRKLEIQDLPQGTKGKWPSALRSFAGRLRWHCHFIQKLEDEPRLEFENLHPAYDGLREDEFNQAHFDAWKEGRTGYPMVDACMRALIATGWLNFRMRSMLMSFASYHLWLHWREPALYLARLFTDYEPGIHYSQTQMQSGTTGINSLRIYNPIKQGMDHDPEGIFIRKWIPELADMPQAHIQTPWTAPDSLNGYPLPIVDEKTARKAAANKLYALRKTNAHREFSKKIADKHGSRKSGLLRTVKSQTPKPHAQKEFAF
jgi:deoxyribodipyrimidine photo-lyase